MIFVIFSDFSNSWKKKREIFFFLIIMKNEKKKKLCRLELGYCPNCIARGVG